MSEKHSPTYRIARFAGRLACAGTAAFAGGWLDASGYFWSAGLLHVLAIGTGLVAFYDM